MKKNFNKIAAIVIAMVMVFAMSAVSFAATAETLPKNDPKVVTGTDISSVTFKVYFNENKGEVARPVVNFEYEIAPAEAGVPAVGIEAGVRGKATLPTDATTDAWDTVNGTSSYDEITVTFGIFAKSGIYRYKLTQKALSTDAQTLGVKNEAGTTAAVDKYLDVYVDNTKKVVAAVLSGGAVPTKNNTTMTYSDKTDGFRNVLGNNNTDDPDDQTDDAIGYKVTVSKSVSGDMADTSSFFPFKATVTAAGTGDAGMWIYVDTADSNTAWVPSQPIAEQGQPSPGNATVGSEFEFGIANGGSVVISGLTKAQAVAIEEDLAQEHGYTVDVTPGNFASNTKAANANGVANARLTGTMGETDATAAFSNTRDSISPTGVVLRYAPYLLILAAGIALVVISRRRKSQED